MSAPRSSTLRLIPAILAGLILRRTGVGTGPRSEGSTGTPHRDWDYERSDIAAGRTALVMLGLAGAVLATIAAVLALDRFVLARQRAARPPLTAQQVAAIRPPPPNLQVDPYADIDAKAGDEAARLSAYAYLDAARTRARIPVARAMVLMDGRPFDPAPGAVPEPGQAGRGNPTPGKAEP